MGLVNSALKVARAVATFVWVNICNQAAAFVSMPEYVLLAVKIVMVPLVAKKETLEISMWFMAFTSNIKAYGPLKRVV